LYLPLPSSRILSRNELASIPLSYWLCRTFS
jgi:hypothetical protein